MPWRAELTTQGIKLAIDVPGIRLTDMQVNIEGASVKVTGQRFDSKANVSHQYALAPDYYDVESADASLEAGVLTIVIARLKQTCTRKVPITEK